ncbi:M3 family oligoendopeptidase [Pseudalkalibacillus caeni]|uniref:M3 family oligoendopeptidase n=1 Tax=Exobacillus caeni TaxID=2574798 RepID=A0A5R9F8L9_9BACL|nr:M3 family oligoendopeptidase [Pseudalkalibacillus caeni]TLS37968.1 M3 family oligoendopeptidase [Pseudalkalibacillus caeni]
MINTLSQKWSLDAIFSNGSDSEELHSFLVTLEEKITSLTGKIEGENGPQSDNEIPNWLPLLNKVQTVSAELFEVNEFVECLQAQDVTDEKANTLSNRVYAVNAMFDTLNTYFDQQLQTIPETTWKLLLKQEEVKAIAFPLQEKRENAKEKLPVEQEALINDLSINGYHAWDNLYNATLGKLKIPFETEGEIKKLSPGQAYHLLVSTNERNERKALAEGFKTALKEVSEVSAAALNNIGGFRLQVYKHRGWSTESILKEPLQINRLTDNTLDTMWNVINQNKPVLLSYLKRKAELLGLEKLSWYDISASVGESTKKYTYEEAAEMIVANFSTFGSELAETARKAFEESWIDCEDRDTKAPGGFAARFPLTKESRVFMNFHGSPESIATLAHELGHVFHQGIISKSVPPFSQTYAMAVGETASTFAENIVADANIKNARDKREKLSLLDTKIQPAITYFMGIQSRFEFEKKFYEERKKKSLSTEELTELMLEAEKYAFNDSLESYNEYGWISTRHFYMTDKPFYNFPYTFGFLFSQGIYAMAKKEGHSFEEKYIELLKDTGRMSAETLALKHLGIDLTKPDFWTSAIDGIRADIKEFLAITE